MQLALCRQIGGDTWIEPVDAADVELAVSVCERCPVRRDCQEHALATREWGVWGGELLREGKRWDARLRAG